MKEITVFVALAVAWFCLKNADAQQNPGTQFQSRSFQYLAAEMTAVSPSPVTVSCWNAAVPPKYFTLSVTTQATGWVALLEGSLDNAKWTTLAVTNSAVGSVSNSVPFPALYLRTRANVIGSTSTITGTAIGVP